jgi:hypothetical protein
MLIGWNSKEVDFLIAVQQNRPSPYNLWIIKFELSNHQLLAEKLIKQEFLVMSKHPLHRFQFHQVGNNIRIGTRGGATCSGIHTIPTRMLAYSSHLALSVLSLYQYPSFPLPCAFPFLDVDACPGRL